MTKGQLRDIGSIAGIVLFSGAILFAVAMAISSCGSSSVQTKIAASK